MTTRKSELKHFRLFLAIRFFATIAVQMQSVAIGWQVYAMTGSLLSLGTVGLMIFLPFFLLSFFSGDLVDRFNRKKILFAGIVAQVFVSAWLCRNAILETPTLWGIYGSLLCIGATRAFIGPASSSLLPNIVSQGFLARAIALNSTTWQTATILGPAIGGLLYAQAQSLPSIIPGGGHSESNSAAVVYLACSLIFALCALGLPWVLAARTIPLAQGTFWQRFKEGLQFVFQRKIIFGAITLDLFAVLLGGAVALLPAVAKDVLQAGPEALGLLRSASSVGAAGMAFLLSLRPLSGGAGKKMLLAVFLFGLATIGFGLSQVFWLSILCLMVMGAADMVSVIVRQTLIQLHTPDALRGRVSAVSQVFIGASNELGEFESGLTAAWFGLQRAIVLGGIGTCVIALSWTRFFPELRAADRLDQP
jgi:MFS family permease